MRRHFGADIVAATRTILDEERLSEALAQLLGDEPRDQISAAAGRGGDQDADRSRRICLGERDTRCQSCPGDTEQECTTLHECCHRRSLSGQA
jgi:hypothetical protein